MDIVFLDTNVVIDFLGERTPYYDSIAKVLTLADQRKVKVYVSPMSLATAHYILSRDKSNKHVLEQLRKFKVLTKISALNDVSVEKALNSDFKDFEDAMQYFSALESKCNVLITRNEKDFKHALIPVMNAEHYLKLRKQ